MGLRDLFKTAPTSVDANDGAVVPAVELLQFKKDDSETYEDWGYRLAGQTRGGSANHRNYLYKVINDIKQAQQRDKQKQDAYKEGLNRQIMDKEAEIERYRKDIDDRKGLIEALKEKIEKLNLNITEKSANDVVDKLGLIIGTLILLFITVYLLIFYSSASYSAFFRVFTIDSTNLTQAIFDAQALTKAWHDGFTELVLILTIPFVFLGLGYLIHKFQEDKKYIKLTVVVLGTFLFDAILAYEIVKKIYEIKAANSFDDLPEYSVAMALEDVSFWVIIFSGFMVYLIWGFIFDIVMNGYNKEKRQEQRTAKERQEIAQCERRLSDHEKEIASLQSKINEVGQEKAKLINERDTTFTIDRVEISQELTNFHAGWLRYLKGLNNQTQSEIISSCQSMFDEIIATIN